MHLQDSLYLEERDLSGDLEEVLGFICITACTWNIVISLEILRKSLRIHLQDRLYLEERDLSGDLEEGS